MSELGDLLELLHGAQRPFATLRASYRVWTHHERSTAAFMSTVKDASSVSVLYGPEDEEPIEASEYVESIWRAPGRARIERGENDADTYGVRVGKRWWSWSKDMGAVSNEREPEVHSEVGEELRTLLDPTQILGALRFMVSGSRGEVAGRPTISAEAEPRRVEDDGPGSFSDAFALHELGTGAERYRLEVDAERGVLLSVEAIREGLPFARTEAVEIAFDVPLEDDLFVFRPPPDEQVHSPLEGHSRPERLGIADAQARAPFTVLMPDRVPAGWELSCMYIGPSVRPTRAASVSLSYRSESAHEDVSIEQTSATEEHPLQSTKGWEQVARDSSVFEVRSPGYQTQLRLERGGTYVLMTSGTLSTDRLADLAARLIAAPEQSEI